MQVSNLSPVSFNGQYRNVKVKKISNHEFRARVLDSQNDSGRCLFCDEAVYRAIVNSNDFKQNSKIEKLNHFTVNRRQKEVLTSVYYTDENEKVNMKQVKPNASFIIYAPGSTVQD